MQEILHQVIHRGRDDEGVIEVIDDEITRSLYFGSRAKQSCMLLCNAQVLVLNYTQAMSAALLFLPAPRSVLMIGLGGGSLARFFHHHFPHCRITAVENRSEVIRVAQRYFSLPDDERLQLYSGCAWSYLEQAPEENFDLILLDIFTATGMDSDLDRPGFFQHCQNRLHPGGVVSANLWATRPNLCKQHLKNLRRTFNGQVLELPAPNCGNLIAFALNSAPSTTRLSTLGEQAKILQQQLGIDYPDLLDRMRRRNRFSLRRLFR